MTRYEKQDTFLKYKNKTGDSLNIGDIVEGDDKKKFRIKEVVYGNSKISYPIKAIEVKKDIAGNFAPVLNSENRYEITFLKPSWLKTVSSHNSFLFQEKNKCKKVNKAFGKSKAKTSSDVSAQIKNLVACIFNCKKELSKNAKGENLNVDYIKHDAAFNDQLNSLIKMFI